MAKFKNYEEAEAALEKAKAKRNELKTKVDAFCKENKLSPLKDHSDHEKYGKAYKKVAAPLKEARKEVEEIKEAVKSLKPKKESIMRSIYTYPADCVTDAEKKRYRTQQRALKAKAAKGETVEETPKKEKKAEKGGKIIEEVNNKKESSKKDKKKKTAVLED